MHEGMRNFQVGLIDGKIIVEQDIDVDRTIFVFTIYGFLGRAKRFASPIYYFVTSQFALYLLSNLEHLSRSQAGLTEDNTIEELVIRLESPGFSLNQ